MTNMKILIDINHPAHVHYFRNLIKLMEAKGHEFCVINRDSKMINQLLDYYGIKHTIRNKRPEKKGTIASMLNLIRMTLWCIRYSFRFHPDMYIGFASSACAITSQLFRKPCILMDDTEHNTMNHKIYMPVCSAVLTPFYFYKNLQEETKTKRNKQIRFNAYVEQLYLHSVYYNKSKQVLHELGVNPSEYVIVRYIAYDAHHDIAAQPLSDEVKKLIVTEIAKQFRVLLSLENEANDPFYDEYVLRISPEKMHDLEAHARFMVTEGATMASESFVHGVPYLYINPLKCGNIDYQCMNYPNRCFQTIDANEALNIIYQMMNMQTNSEMNKQLLEKETINPTKFLEKFVEYYSKNRQ